jgi:hypothetical protein
MLMLQFERQLPNPPIAEEFWGMGRSQQGIGAEEALWEGMRGPLRLELWAGGRLRLGDVQAEDTPVRFSPRGLENPLITMTF